MKTRLGMFLLIGLIALQWLAYNQGPGSSEDMASKQGRSAQLGKPVPIKNKPEKEMEVLLNDPAISAAWGLKMTDSQKAWRISQGSRDITVAIVDTGIDAQHPDLTRNLWVNRGETGNDSKGRDKATNGVDDDSNGYIDDVHGWNFVENNNNLKDDHGHGTHIAGIVGAEGGNGVGISGVAPKISMMVLKYYDAKGTEVNNLINTVKAIDYAVKMNANIINYSGGGIAPSPDEKSAIERAMRKGILFVAAAGNERSNSDLKKYYPADYGLPNILSVTAIDRFQNVLPSSNFGEQTVDVAAPGNDIISTLPNGQYGYMTGTSQATAFATGVAALVMANNSSLRKADQIRKYLTQTGDTDMKLVGKTRYRKRLNSYKALATQDSDLAFNGSVSQSPTRFAASSSDEDEDGAGLPGDSKITTFGKKIKTHLGLKVTEVNAGAGN
jgi:subtilisin family serine protease